MQEQPDSSAFLLFVFCLALLLPALTWAAYRLLKADREWKLLCEGVVSSVRESVAPGSLRPKGGALPTVPVEEKVICFADGNTLRLPKAALSDDAGLLKEGECVSVWVNGNGKFAIRV